MNMEMKKALWSNDGDTFSLSMSISKVDKVRRLVFGWATVDNPDLQNDVVTFEASQRAFAKFKGNLREMHQPIAAGRMVEYRPQQYVDPESGKAYNGLFVSAYVSEGAENTWKKVLDGTLAAFSINGDINDSYSQYDPETGKTLRYVTDYTMKELSLVDSGGNQYSNVVSFAKSVDGEMHVEGDLANVELANVFLCKTDHLVELSESDSLSCQHGHEMENIGWVEAKTPNTMEKVNALVKERISMAKSDKGGVDEMADEAVTETKEETPVAEETAVEATEEAVVVEEVPAAVETTEETEKVEEVEEKEEPEASAVESLEKAIGDAIEELKKSDERREERVAQIVKDIDGKMDSFKEEFDKRFAAYEEKQGEISKALATVTEGLQSMSKDVTGLQESSAIKKSGDLGGEPEGTLVESEKPGVWRGSIL